MAGNSIDEIIDQPNLVLSEPICSQKLGIVSNTGDFDNDPKEKEPSEKSLEKELSEESLEKELSEKSLEKEPSEKSLEKEGVNNPQQKNTLRVPKMDIPLAMIKSTLTTQGNDDDHLEYPSNKQLSSSLVNGSKLIRDEVEKVVSQSRNFSKDSFTLSKSSAYLKLAFNQPMAVSQPNNKQDQLHLSLIG